MQNDPLWKLRHALAGVGLALLLSVPVAALLGSALGDALGGTYGWRAGVYSVLLLYVVVGAFVLFAKVARHETRPLSAQRVGLWLVSLWLWPGLWLVAARRSVTPASAPAPSTPSTPSTPSASDVPASGGPAAGAPASGAAASSAPAPGAPAGKPPSPPEPPASL